MSAQVTPPVTGARLILDSQSVGAIVSDALMRGKADGLFNPLVEYAGDCASPVYLDLHGKRLLDHPSGQFAHGRGATLQVPCRKCPPCLKARSNSWAARAIDELKFWPRTWFGTLTISPERHFLCELTASARVRARRNEAWGALKPGEQFGYLVGAISPELTKWLKRIRKESGARLRYLLVAEAHKSGLPHFHLLVHEMEGSVRKRTLEGQWVQGFSHWRLVDNSKEASAFYVCKYLAKSALVRIRASAAYGQPIKALSRAANDNSGTARTASEAMPECSEGVVCEETERSEVKRAKRAGRDGSPPKKMGHPAAAGEPHLNGVGDACLRTTTERG